MLEIKARLIPVETDNGTRYRAAELKDGAETDLLAVLVAGHAFAGVEELRNFLTIRLQREAALSASEGRAIEGGTAVN